MNQVSYKHCQHLPGKSSEVTSDRWGVAVVPDCTKLWRLSLRGLLKGCLIFACLTMLASACGGSSNGGDAGSGDGGDEMADGGDAGSGDGGDEMADGGDAGSGDGGDEMADGGDEMADGGDAGSGDGGDEMADGGDAGSGDGGDEMAEIDRSGEVIRVGYVNNEGAAFALPEFRIGGEVAIEAINESGGIHGAIIEPVVCLSDGTPEGAINCANDLIEENVVLAYMGIELASEAAIGLWVDAGIPYISSNSWGDTERNSPGAFLLHAAAGAYAVGPAKTFKDLGIGHIAVVLEDSPSQLDFLETIITPVLAHNEIEWERIIVNAAAPDYAAAIATAQATGVEAIWGQFTEGGCIGLVGAADASGYDKPIFAGSCSIYIDVLGEAAVGTYTQSDAYGVFGKQFAPPEIAERLDDYVAEMTAAGHEDYIHGFTVLPYSAWREIEFVLETIEGPITSESVALAFATAGTTPGWFGPDLRCGQAPWPAESSHCGSQIAVWRVVLNEDGTIGRELVGDGFFDAFEYSGF